jgi:hypothetical protein
MDHSHYTRSKSAPLETNSDLTANPPIPKTDFDKWIIYMIKTKLDLALKKYGWNELFPVVKQFLFDIMADDGKIPEDLSEDDLIKCFSKMNV